MSSKIFHISLAILFIVFGVLNFNDPDFYIWGPVYVITATIPVLYTAHKLRSGHLVAWMLITGIYMATYLPELLDWIRGGMENIAGSMKAEEPHIELTREFFGLLLCFLVPFGYYFAEKRQI